MSGYERVMSILLRKLASAKIAKFACVVVVEKDVLRFQVTVDDFFRFRRVQEEKCTGYFSCYASSNPPGHWWCGVFAAEAILESSIRHIFINKGQGFRAHSDQSQQMWMPHFA